MSNEKIHTSARDRKIFRKQKKLQHMLNAETGIEMSNKPEKNIAVCNAGLGTELDEQKLLEEFQKYGDVERVVMLPGKSYCFVIFTNDQNAAKAFEAINGETDLAQGGHPLYLSFIPSVPQTESQMENDPPEGLRLHCDFITKEEELSLLSSLNWGDETNTGSMKHRRVKHFGYEFMYTNNNIDLNNPLAEKIPPQCDILWERLNGSENHCGTPPNQLTVNQYSPGQGIPSHVDTHSAFLSPILSLSLGSAVVMEFRLGQKRYNMLLPRRSLLIMDGAARYEWSHGIAPKRYDLIAGRTYPRGERTSFTFRWVRPDAFCRCEFNKQCDTFLAKHSGIDDSLASLIEKQHVHQVYEKIASHFNETRSKIWTSVRNFIGAQTSGTFLVDIGCGNGKNLRIRQDIMHLGIEYNGALAEVAKYGDGNESNEGISLKAGRIEVSQADCLYLPLRSQCADAVISIAVFHHLATQERRIQAISEAIRILQPQGRALITVWAKDQARGEKTSYLKQNRKNRKQQESLADMNEVVTEEIKDTNGISLPVHINRTQFQHQDLLVPWKLKSSAVKDDDVEEKMFMRYYHVFEEGELDNVCKQVPNARVVESFYEQGNWCIILERIS